MKKTVLFLSALMVTLFSVVLSSCSSDDDDNIPLIVSEYIIGNWHSYKMDVYLDGEKVSANLTKTGQYSQGYIEVEFKEGGQAIGRSWQQDKNGLSQWVEQSTSYSVNGTTVTLYWSDGNEQLFFDEKSKNLYARAVVPIDGETATAYIYLKKK